MSHNRHHESRANYDRLSRWYDLLGASSERAAKLRGLQLLNVQPKERVLEIGCGTGESLPALSAANRVFGLDLSAGMLGAARKKLKKFSVSNADCLQGDGVCLPFSDKSFDAVFMSFTLELFPAEEIPLLLRECMRVLRPGGRIGVVSLARKENPNYAERIYNWAHRRFPRIVDCRPILLEDIMKDAGFEISSAQEISMWGLAVGILSASKQ
ncbi:MAG: methyltransferase domain-containing protein [Anaerolineales bacterium]|nr:methyltransferase domain-containing protein [Anaerolineales bacterium]